MLTTDPFRRKPKALAQLPRIVRMYILNVLTGFALAVIFTGLVFYFNVANIWYLVTNVSGGPLAGFVFFMLNAIVFAGVQSAVAIMLLGADERTPPSSGRPVPVPVRPNER